MSGIYVRPATESNRVKVATLTIGTADQALEYPIYNDFLHEINKGNVASHSITNVLGSNPVVGTGTSEDIWSAGGTLTFPTAATIVDIVSSDANDTAAGSGARTVTIQGLASDFTEQSETVTLNGVTPVSTVNSYIRINYVEVATVGTYGGSNAGNLTIQVTGGGDTLSYIEIGESRSNNSHYTIPSGYTGYVLSASITVQAAQEADVHLVKRENADTVSAPFSPLVHIHHWEGVGSTIEETFHSYYVLPEKTDVWGQAIATGGVSASVQMDYDLLLIANA